MGTSWQANGECGESLKALHGGLRFFVDNPRHTHAQTIEHTVGRGLAILRSNSRLGLRVHNADTFLDSRVPQQSELAAGFG